MEEIKFTEEDKKLRGIEPIPPIELTAEEQAEWKEIEMLCSQEEKYYNYDIYIDGKFEETYWRDYKELEHALDYLQLIKGNYAPYPYPVRIVLSYGNEPIKTVCSGKSL
jgi:hypothetical protein